MSDEILAAIAQYSRENGYPPSVRELVALVGASSTSVIDYHLRRLRRAGRVTWVQGKARTLRVMEVTA
jgi:repressor LexA